MALIVQKFGGTSLADIDMIRKIAARIIDTHIRGHDLVIVLSAMAGVTDKLIRLAYEISSYPDKRELDVLLATGEQTSVSILAMMLKNMGYKAQSALGYQIGIITNSSYGSAHILDINVSNIEKIIKKRTIAVIAGFQGCDSSGNVTTLGRGGSDTSAVAIAAALKADLCEIYTDVDGIYTADPNICPNAKKLDIISYDDMFNMAELGTKVLHKDSIDFAKNYKISVHVRSSLSFSEGTMVLNSNSKMCQSGIIGITYDLSYALIIIRGVPVDCNINTKFIDPIKKLGILVDMIYYSTAHKDCIDVVFSVLKEEFNRVLEIEKLAAKYIKSLDIIGNEETTKVSVVGFNMISQPNIFTYVLRSLREANIDILMFDRSEVKISCMIEAKKMHSAVRILHSKLGLG